jgi:hypothetical protein
MPTELASLLRRPTNAASAELLRLVGVVTLFDGEDPDRALGDLGYERTGPWRGTEYGHVCDVRRRQH